MKGYLTHLIRRQQGETPAIRPRLPSRFERAVEVEQPAMKISAAVSAGDRHTPREPSGSRDATVALPPARTHAPASNAVHAGAPQGSEMAGLTAHEYSAIQASVTARETPQSPQAGVAEPGVAAIGVTRLSAPNVRAAQSVTPQEETRHAAPLGLEMASSTVPEHSATQASVTAREMPPLPQARVAEPLVTRMSASNVRASQPVMPPEEPRHAAPPRRTQTMAAAERPLIRVSIGRIDVRADLSKPAPPKPGISVRAPQPMPLADYLKGRGAA